MRKLAFLLPILAMGIIACSSCSKNNQVLTSPSPSTCDSNSCPLESHDAGVADSAVDSQPPITNVVSQENWQFTLPSTSNWTSNVPRSPTIKVVMKDSKTNCQLLFVKEVYTDTYSKYVLSQLRKMSAGGAMMVSSKASIINNNKFVAAEVRDGDSAVWAWVTQKDGFGYTLACGGELKNSSDVELKTLCLVIANSLFVK